MTFALCFLAPWLRSRRMSMAAIDLPECPGDVGDELAKDDRGLVEVEFRLETKRSWAWASRSWFIVSDQHGRRAKKGMAAPGRRGPRGPTGPAAGDVDRRSRRRTLAVTAPAVKSWSAENVGQAGSGITDLFPSPAPFVRKLQQG